MNNSELLKEAKSTVEKRRVAAQLDCDERREKIYEAVPELFEIDSKKISLGVSAARFAADGQKNEANKRLEEIRIIEEKRDRLLKNRGYSPEDLMPRYNCRLCDDKGVVNGRYCACIDEEIKSMRRRQIHTKGALRTASFDTFSIDKYPDKLEGFAVSPKKAMAAILQDAKDYAATFGRGSESIYMYGNAGLGKTHLALSIAGEVLDKGYNVIYVSAQSAFASVSEKRFAKGGEIFSTMLEADLLVLDDLGTEYQDNYTMSMFYQLVNTRMHNRPTIYTTNICTADLLNMRYTEKIASRLMGDCHLMRFLGNDIRLMKY